MNKVQKQRHSSDESEGIGMEFDFVVTCDTPAMPGLKDVGHYDVRNTLYRSVNNKPPYNKKELQTFENFV